MTGFKHDVYGDGAWDVTAPAALRVLGGSLLWLSADIPLRRLGTTDPTGAAAIFLVALAAAAVEACASVERVFVAGHGLVATEISRRLGTRLSGCGDFDTAVDTTGDEHTISSLLSSAPTFGTVVVASAAAHSLPINLYPDVHVRGLEVVGVVPSLVHDDSWQPSLDVREAAKVVPSPARCPGQHALWWHEIRSRPLRGSFRLAN